MIPRVAKKLWNFAILTDGYTDGLEPIGIIPRVAKKLQNFTTLTDGLVPICILPIVAQTLQPLPPSLTDIPTYSAMDGANSKVHDCQTA
jgi:hypothetical protein